jgi:hypothetical protein
LPHDGERQEEPTHMKMQETLEGSSMPRVYTQNRAVAKYADTSRGPVRP